MASLGLKKLWSLRGSRRQRSGNRLVVISI
nr:MAG TPA: hypothetical protein [Caudoviricetes sp.]